MTKLKWSPLRTTSSTQSLARSTHMLAVSDFSFNFFLYNLLIFSFFADRQQQKEVRKFFRPQTGTVEGKMRAFEKLNLQRGNDSSSFGLFNQPHMVKHSNEKVGHMKLNRQSSGFGESNPMASSTGDFHQASAAQGKRGGIGGRPPRLAQSTAGLGRSRPSAIPAAAHNQNLSQGLMDTAKMGSQGQSTKSQERRDQSSPEKMDRQSSNYQQRTPIEVKFESLKSLSKNQ